jgi:hypothetical protein
MGFRSFDRKTRNKAIVLTAFIAIALYVFVYPRLASTAKEIEEPKKIETNSQTNRKKRRPNYAKFSHSVPQHKKACDSCHSFPSPNWNEVRKGDTAFPDITEYPKHESCLECHHNQFFNGIRPVICSICHVKVTPRGGARHPFSNPSETFDVSPKGEKAVSEFGIAFPHDKHLEIVGQMLPDKETNRNVQFIATSFRSSRTAKAPDTDPKSCGVCHQTYQPQGESEDEFITKPPKSLAENDFWLKKGAFKTSPNHSSCFTCHSQDSGIAPAPSDCAACHKLLSPEQIIDFTKANGDFLPQMATTMGIKDKTTLERWSARDTSKFRHEWLPHDGLSCTSCHDVSSINTADVKSKKVKVLSCGGAEGTGCHIENSLEGILNLEIEKKKTNPNFQCVKCHVSYGLGKIPSSHFDALPKANTK